MPRLKSTHVDDPKAVGRRLRGARERAGLSQRQLSFPGCSPAYISRIEAGDRIPSLQLLRELGSRLGVSEDYLATGRERPLPEERELVAAEVALRLGEHATAGRLYREGLEGASSPDERARGLEGLGRLALAAGEPHRAVEHLEAAAAVQGRGPAGAAEAEALGLAYSLAGRPGAAIDVFDASLAAARARENELDGIRFSILLANALLENNEQPARAAELLGSVVARSGDAHDPAAQARVLWEQSRRDARRNDSSSAARYARRALEALELAEQARHVATAHGLLAQVELDRGNAREGLELARRGRELSVGGDGGRDVLALEEARALAQLGEREAAAAIAAEVGSRVGTEPSHEVGLVYAQLAEVDAELGNRARAIELYQRAVERLAARPDRHLVRAYTRLAELLEADGRTDDALGVLRRAVGVGTAPRAALHDAG